MSFAFPKRFVKMMEITLPTNFHEKMKFTISQYIGELDDLGIIEKETENYKLLLTRNPNIQFVTYIIYMMFDDSTPKYNKVRMLNQAANNYFNEDDKKELKNYYLDCVRNSRGSKKDRDVWLEDSRAFMFILARIFAGTNKPFIMEEVKGPTCDLILK
jgi:hypothetical protein